MKSLRSERAGYKFILILIIAFLLSLTVSCAYASTDQTEYSSSVAQLIINAGKEEPAASSLRKRGSNQPGIVLARVSSGEPDLSGCNPQEVLSGPHGKYRMLFASTEEAGQAIELLKKQSNVVYAEPDAPVVACATSLYEHTDYTFHSWAAEPLGFPEILDMCSVEASGSVTVDGHDVFMAKATDALDAKNELRQYYENGGSLFLTRYATNLPSFITEGEPMKRALGFSMAMTVTT